MELPKHPTVHTAVNVLKLCLDVGIFIAAVLEISARFVPPPALVYDQQEPIVAGSNHMSQVQFKNPTSNWPIDAIRAEWQTTTPTLTLNVDLSAPKSRISSPLSSVRVLETEAPLAAQKSFVAVFQDPEPFDLSKPSIRATVPTYNEGDVLHRQIPALDSKAYEANRSEGLLRLGIIVGMAFTLIVLMHLLLTWLQREFL